MGARGNLNLHGIMFAYLRYFSAASFLIIIVAAYFAGNHFRDIAAEDLRVVVEKNNSALAQGYVNTIWRNKYYREMFDETLAGKPMETWVQNKRYLTFVKNTFRYFEALPLVKLYTDDQRLFLTNDAHKGGISQVGLITQPDAAAKLRQGEVHSTIRTDMMVENAEGAMQSGTLVQTVIPILGVSDGKGGHEIEGYIEVYFDVTTQWQQLDDFQMKGTAGIIGIFVLLFAALVFTAKRAETIIAKQHERNQELASAKSRAESENREKSRFLANISHELRTPLNAIIGFSEIIKGQSMGPLGNNQYEEYIHDIHSSGVHLLSLINDILDYSKAEAGKLELEASEIDAVKVIKNCMRLVSTRAEEAGVNLVEEVPKEHFVVNTDAKKLKQILLNLMSNAVKFTPAGGTVTVTAWQNMTDESVTIQVKDSGIGIAPKDISRAMSPFGQVDSELSRKYEGTGLGLPLTKKLTEVMGGKFTIQSELNVGTTVTIALPKEAPKDSVKKGPNIKANGDDAFDDGDAGSGLTHHEPPTKERADAVKAIMAVGDSSEEPSQPPAPEGAGMAPIDTSHYTSVMGGMADAEPHLAGAAERATDTPSISPADALMRNADAADAAPHIAPHAAPGHGQEVHNDPFAEPPLSTSSEHGPSLLVPEHAVAENPVPENPFAAPPAHSAAEEASSPVSEPPEPPKEMSPSPSGNSPFGMPIGGNAADTAPSEIPPDDQQSDPPVGYTPPLGSEPLPPVAQDASPAPSSGDPPVGMAMNTLSFGAPIPEDENPDTSKQEAEEQIATNAESADEAGNTNALPPAPAPDAQLPLADDQPQETAPLLPPEALMRSMPDIPAFLKEDAPQPMTNPQPLMPEAAADDAISADESGEGDSGDTNADVASHNGMFGSSGMDSLPAMGSISPSPQPLVSPPGTSPPNASDDDADNSDEDGSADGERMHIPDSGGHVPLFPPKPSE